MRKTIWFGIIVWGILVTSFGLGLMNPIDANPGTLAVGTHAPGGIFLLIGGIVTSAIGLAGLLECIQTKRKT